MQKTKKILVAGATGLLGTRLVQLLKSQGYSVNVLVRNNTKSDLGTTYTWDIAQQRIDLACVKDVDAIINLCGENVMAQRWTTARKKEIIDSRVESCNLIYTACVQANSFPRVYVSASAIGIYGLQASGSVDEQYNAHPDDFLSHCCKEWESATSRFVAHHTRTASIRIGIVLSSKGGAMKEMMAPLKMFTAIQFGNGSQALPWVHIDDVCRALIFAVENDTVQGPYNCVAPSQNTYRHLSMALMACFSPGIKINIPYPIAYTVLGERAMLLYQNIRPTSSKLQSTGFNFIYNDLTVAVNDLLSNKK